MFEIVEIRRGSCEAIDTIKETRFSVYQRTRERGVDKGAFIWVPNNGLIDDETRAAAAALT